MPLFDSFMDKAKDRVGKLQNPPEKVDERKFKSVEQVRNTSFQEPISEKPKKENMKYFVRLPSNSDESRMMVVADYSANEYRLFFMSEDQEESFFRQG